MARSYLRAMAWGALGAAALVAGINWFVDPLSIHDSPRIEGVNALKPALKTRSRIFKTITVANGRWDALIVGTSRAETGFDPGHPYFGGMRCFNAALGGQTYEESFALVRAASGAGNVRRVVAVLDFPVANAYYEGPSDYTLENYRPWRKAALALSLATLDQSARTLAGQDERALAQEHALWMPNGRFVFPPSPRGPRAAALASESAYLRGTYFRGPMFRFALATPSARPIDDVRRLIALSHERGIDLVIVIAPAHARQWETIAAAGLWDEWEQWKRALASANRDEAAAQRRPAFPLWDFSGYNEVTTEPFPPLGSAASMRWYYESSHFTPEAGNRVLGRIGGNADAKFGVRLDTIDVENHLRALRADRIAWREANPADAAEIDALGREAASFRGLHGAR